MPVTQGAEDGTNRGVNWGPDPARHSLVAPSSDFIRPSHQASGENMNRLLIEKEDTGFHVRRQFDDPMNGGEVMAYLEVLIGELHVAMQQMKEAE